MNNNVISSTKRLAIEDLREDMILAKDVLNEWGAVLLPKGTILTHNTFERLHSNGIRYIHVVENSINFRKSTFLDIPGIIEPTKTKEEIKTTAKKLLKQETNRLNVKDKRIPNSITERNEFNEFKSIYIQNSEKIKNNLLAIGAGEGVDTNTLFELTDDIINKFKSKSDILLYLHFLESTDEHTFSHSNNVALLCNLFGKWLELDEEELINLTVAGALHDVGKTKIDINLLNKQQPLTREEYEHIKEHPMIGFKLVEHQSIPNSIKLAVLLHHEKIDGTGYPLGFKSNQIASIAKIVSICDIYDAMTSDRTYREKICPFTVLKDFEHNSFEKLDTKYLLVFLHNISYTYLGSWVELNTGQLAEVVFINPGHLSRPMVRTKDDQIIDLQTNKNIEILRII